MSWLGIPMPSLSNSSSKYCTLDNLIVSLKKKPIMIWAFDWLSNNKDTEYEEEIWSISDLELDLDLIKFFLS